MRLQSTSKLVALVCLCILVANTDAWRRRRRRRSPPPPPARCSTIYSPGAGTVTCTNSNIQGSTCSFACSTGYTLQGSRTISCQSDGRWSATCPTCLVNRCPAVSNPVGGSVACTNGNIYGSSCTFSCATGYTLGGFQIIRCLSNGQWSGTPATCTVNRCPSITHPARGTLTCTNGNIYGSACTFSCSEGYTLHGTRTIRCQSTSQWSTVCASCSVTRCPALLHPTGGTVACTNGNIYGSSCSVICSTGYNLQGSQTISCLSNGQWSGAAATCSVKTCTAVVDPAGGSVACTSENIYGSSCTFSCSTGYTLQGSETISCLSSGQWSGTSANCSVNRCPAIANPTGGTATCTNGDIYGSSCTFTCSTGYTLQGFQTISCQDDGRWSGAPASCSVNRCPAIGDPAGGTATCTDGNIYGSSCNFSCSTGYTLQGAETISCLSTGQWSGMGATCSAKYPCPSPYIAPYSRILNEAECPWSSGDDLPAGTVCQYGCNEGHTLVGSDSITCADNGWWTGSPPQCQVVTCDRITVPENGYVNRCPFEEVVYGTACVLNCDHGYKPTTPSEVTCVADDNGSGVWNGTIITTCEEIKCPPLASPPDGFVKECVHDGNQTDVTDQQSHDTVCTAACDQGFRPVGQADRTCLRSGTWNAQPLKCKAMCSPGSYRGTDGSCVLCEIGYYQPDSGKTFCKKCDEGLTTNQPGATAEEDCQPESNE